DGVNPAFIWIVGDNGPDFTRNACGMPGAMQLLPAPAYAPVPGSSWNPQLPWDANPVRPPNILGAGEDEYVRSNLTARLRELAGYQADDTEFRFDPERTVAIFGDGEETDVAV